LEERNHKGAFSDPVKKERINFVWQGNTMKPKGKGAAR